MEEADQNYFLCAGFTVTEEGGDFLVNLKTESHGEMVSGHKQCFFLLSKQLSIFLLSS